MIAAILVSLLEANLAASAGVLLVLVLRRPMRGRFGARAVYVLWVAPLAAAVAIFAPHPAVVTPMSPIVYSAEAAAAFVAQTPAAVGATGPDAGSLLFAGWLGGALAAGGLVVRRQRRFTVAMGRLTPSGAADVFRAEKPDVGPAVVGLFRPRIVAPADFEERFAPQERDLILTHERVHLAGGDASINALACAVQCLCWFNPLAHLAVRLLRVDQELACDATVIGRFPQMRRVYAELLLKTQIATQPLPLGCHWPAGADHPLKERIAMLKSPPPAFSMRTTGLVVAGGLSLAAGGLAWSAQPPSGALDPAEAVRRLQPGETLDCKPDENREIHSCRIKGSPFTKIATAADVRREWPAEAKKSGLTAWVVLQCTPNLKTGRLDGCASYHDGGAATSPALKAAFDKAAVRVASVYRLKTNPGPNDFVMRPAPGFFTIEFNNDPSRPGGRPKQPPSRFPDFLPGPAGRVVTPPAQGPAKTPVRYAPESYTPHAGFGEPRTNGQSPQGAPFKSIWIKKPTGDDLVAVYPAEAVAKGLGGDVLMTCDVGVDGRLNGCAIVRATVSGDSGAAPMADPGFGAATLELAKLFQMEPTNLQGAPTAGTVIRIPVRFRLPQAPQPVTLS